MRDVECRPCGNNWKTGFDEEAMLRADAAGLSQQPSDMLTVQGD